MLTGSAGLASVDDGENEGSHSGLVEARQHVDRLQVESRAAEMNQRDKSGGTRVMVRTLPLVPSERAFDNPVAT